MNDLNGRHAHGIRLNSTLVAAISLGTVLAPLLIASGQELEDVFGAWKKRKESIGTGRFEWTETLLRTKEALADPLISNGDDVPAEGLTCEYNRSLLFSGEKMRYEQGPEEWVISPQRVYELVKVRRLHVWDGEVARSTKTIEDDSWADSGNVSGREILLQTHDMTPLALAFRPFIWRSAGEEPFVVGKERGRIDDDDCVILSKRIPRGREEWWLDPAKEYAVRRIIRKVSDLEVGRYDIEYQKDARFGWIPSTMGTHDAFG